jgi:hypothetical protein
VRIRHREDQETSAVKMKTVAVAALLLAAAVAQASSAPHRGSAASGPTSSGIATALASAPAAYGVSASALVPAPASTSVAAALPSPSATSAPAAAVATGTFIKVIYSKTGVRWQDPDFTACVATSAQMMLNFIAANGAGGAGFRWTPSVTFAKQTSILAWMRAHDTLASNTPGSDAHGWRNTLNYLGWGSSWTNPAKFTYVDRAYTNATTAVKDAVMAMARTGKPVGLLGWAGGHAQVINGYEVAGEDPAVSGAFTVTAVYLTDPLRKDALRNTRVTMKSFLTGPLKYRFQRYKNTDSPFDDPLTPGYKRSYTEWQGKFTLVVPVR